VLVTRIASTGTAASCSTSCGRNIGQIVMGVEANRTPREAVDEALDTLPDDALRWVRTGCEP